MKRSKKVTDPEKEPIRGFSFWLWDKYVVYALPVFAGSLLAEIHHDDPTLFGTQTLVLTWGLMLAYACIAASFNLRMKDTIIALLIFVVASVYIFYNGGWAYFLHLLDLIPRAEEMRFAIHLVNILVGWPLFKVLIDSILYGRCHADGDILVVREFFKRGTSYPLTSDFPPRRVVRDTLEAIFFGLAIIRVYDPGKKRYIDLGRVFFAKSKEKKLWLMSRAGDVEQEPDVNLPEEEEDEVETKDRTDATKK